MEQSPESDFKPLFFNILSKEDCSGYNSLRANIMLQMKKDRGRNRLKTKSFAESLDRIKFFCVKHDGNDWKRCLVCGICWLQNGIGVNNTTFSKLIDLCKANINFSFQKLGYSLFKDRDETYRIISQRFPPLKNNAAELKRWNVRIFSAETPQPSLPSFAVPSLMVFSTPINGCNTISSPQSPIDHLMSTSPVVDLNPSANEDFFEDPFCLPPDFLLEEEDNS